MVSTKLLLRPNPLSSIIFSPPIHSLFTKPKLTTTNITLSLFSTTATVAAAINNHQSLPYGPSLLKGKSPQTPEPKHQQQNEAKNFFDDSQFTRVFDVAALRAPAKDCYTLESRLRGHLLNWPRVRNIARVSGDEIETQFVNLLGDNASDNDNEDEDFPEVGDELDYVLRREDLAKSFDARGFVKFRNLARISWPRKKKKKREKKEDKEGNWRKGEVYAVEVVEEERKEMKGLLGDEFRGGEKWKGSTRLLLLDEELVDRNVNEFPEAIKVSCEFFSIFNLMFVSAFL